MQVLENPMVVGAAAAWEALHDGEVIEPLTAEGILGAMQSWHRLAAEAARTGHHGKADIAFLDLHDMVCKFGEQCVRTGEVLA